MSESSESRARQIFDLALQEPAEERTAFLRRVCGPETELYRRVVALLEEHEAQGTSAAEPVCETFFSAPSRDRTPAAPESPPPAPVEPPPSPDPTPQHAATAEESGAVIGNYKLLQQIGEGGMGEVWMAEQFQPVRRRVALKVIKLGMDSKQVVVRFEAERQALALMDHPNIAKVLDGGVTESGRPYFVMELVKGIPITDFCDEAKLGIRDRLELFVQVCAAVQHAHQKGIIHRDLKPTNVLVTLHDGKPIPKVIDFGIAKATNQELTQKTLFTEYHQILGTPEYMAPEQASMSGLDVDTRADVYSLGVLLYELLTGTKPFDVREMLERGYEELLRTIREEDPPRPSTRASSTRDETGRISLARQLGEGQLGRVLRGDLDWIVVKAMEKDRTRRYETANGLAADIERHLSDEPVTASPPSAAYRMRKFVRRHRGPVVAGVVVAFALVAGVIGTAVGLFRAIEERERAERAEVATARELARANEVKRLITGMLGSVDPQEALGEDTTLLRRILDATAARLESGEVEDELIEAELHAVVGRTYERIAALGPAEKHLQEAVAIRTRVLGADAIETVRARLLLGQLRSSQGLFSEAMRILEEVLLQCRLQLGEDATETISLQIDRAFLLRVLRRLDEARTAGIETLELARRKLGPEHPSSLNALNNLATVYFSLGQPDEALPLLDELIAVGTRVGGPDSPLVLMAKLNVANARALLGEQAGAETLLLEVVESVTRIYGEAHPRTLQAELDLATLYDAMGRNDKATALRQRVVGTAAGKVSPEHPLSVQIGIVQGTLLLQQGRFPEAARLLRETAERATRLLGERDLRTDRILQEAGEALLQVGENATARNLLRHLHERRVEDRGPDHGSTLATQVSLADALARLGEREEALRLATAAERRLSASAGADDPTTLAAIAVRARLHRAAGEYAEAETLLLDLRRRREGDAARSAEVLRDLGEVYVAAGKLEEADAVVRDLLASLDQQLGARHFSTLSAKAGLASIAHMRGRYSRAEELYREVVDVMREDPFADHPRLIQWQCSLALALGAQRRFTEAEEVLKPARAEAEAREGPDSVSTADVLRHLAMVYMDAGRLNEAEPLLERTIEIVTGLTGKRPHDEVISLAMVRARRGNLAEAEALFREGLAARKAVLGDRDPGNLNALAGLSEVLRRTGHLGEAADMLAETRALMEATLPAGDPRRGQILVQLVGLYLQAGRIAEAVPLIREVIAKSATQFGPDHPATVDAELRLGVILASAGRIEEAEPLLERADRLAPQVFGESHKNTRMAGIGLASVYERRGEYARSEQVWRRVLELQIKHEAPGEAGSLVTMSELGNMLHRIGRSEEAVPLQEKALTGMRAALPPDHPWLRGTLAGLAETYDELGRKDDARAVLVELKPLQLAAADQPNAAAAMIDAAARTLLYEDYPEVHDATRALALAERACKLGEDTHSPDLWSMLETLARAQSRTGDREKALATLDRAIDLAPEHRRAALEKRRTEFESAGG